MQATNYIDPWSQFARWQKYNLLNQSGTQILTSDAHSGWSTAEYYLHDCWGGVMILRCDWSSASSRVPEIGGVQATSIDQIGESWWSAHESACEEECRDDPVKGFCAMDAIPHNVLVRVRTWLWDVDDCHFKCDGVNNSARTAAQHQQIVVVFPSIPTTCCHCALSHKSWNHKMEGLNKRHRLDREREGERDDFDGAIGVNYAVSSSLS